MSNSLPRREALSIDGSDEFRPTNRRDREADRFAAAFLMPLPLLIREVIGVCRGIGTSGRETLATLMLGSDESASLWKSTVLPKITKQFGVSLTAATYRFSELELLDGKPFLLPSHIERILRPRTTRANNKRTSSPTLFDR